MAYTELVLEVQPREPWTDILIAQLAAAGFEGFEETDTGVRAYINSEAYEEGVVKGLELLQHDDVKVSSTTRVVDDENWNKTWESSYAPVTLPGSIHIRASFHEDRPDLSYQVIIDPKMSFGTAHHETTAQMAVQLLQEELANRMVLDMGCGTAVLAILAEKMGASRVVAIDNDPNAVENARENVLKNNCRHVDVLQGDAEAVRDVFNVILANINKNILVRDLPVYANHLKPGGLLLMSGFLQDDLGDLEDAAKPLGLKLHHATTKNNWTMARFIRG
jgi:ribosomal protein L11 methyltransferase